MGSTQADKSGSERAFHRLILTTSLSKVLVTNMEQLIQEIESKIEALKREGDLVLARVQGEYNGRVAELQAMLERLKQQDQPTTE